MKQVLSGYQEVLSRNNLIANGNFTINQRALFGAWTPLQPNDFIADMWYLSASTVENLKGVNGGAIGYIGFLGWGRKGQSFTITNIDYPDNYYVPFVTIDNLVNYTAACLFWDYRAGGIVSVPISCSVTPYYNPGTYTTLHNQAAIVGGKLYDIIGQEAVCAIESNCYYASQYWSPATMVFTLLADGDFCVCASSFRLLSGNFRNPPRQCFVNTAEDVDRCARRYQTGYWLWSGKAIELNTANETAYMADVIRFPVKMHATPTISLSEKQVLAYDGAGASSDRSSQENGTTRNFISGSADTQKFNMAVGWTEATYGTQMFTNGALCYCKWIATC